MSVCLYCGQQISLLGRLRGETRFCSKSHHALYRRENEHLALEAIRQAAPLPAPAPVLPPAGRSDDTVPEFAPPPSASFQMAQLQAALADASPRIVADRLPLEFPGAVSFPAASSASAKRELRLAAHEKSREAAAVVWTLSIARAGASAASSPLPPARIAIAPRDFVEALVPARAGLLTPSAALTCSLPVSEGVGFDALSWRIPQPRPATPVFEAAPQVVVAPVPPSNVLLAFGAPSVAPPENHLAVFAAPEAAQSVAVLPVLKAPETQLRTLADAGPQSLPVRLLSGDRRCTLATALVPNRSATPAIPTMPAGPRWQVPWAELEPFEIPTASGMAATPKPLPAGRGSVPNTVCFPEFTEPRSAADAGPQSLPLRLLSCDRRCTLATALVPNRSATPSIPAMSTGPRWQAPWAELEPFDIPGAYRIAVTPKPLPAGRGSVPNSICFPKLTKPPRSATEARPQSLPLRLLSGDRRCALATALVPNRSATPSIPAVPAGPRWQVPCAELEPLDIPAVSGTAVTPKPLPAGRGSGPNTVCLPRLSEPRPSASGLRASALLADVPLRVDPAEPRATAPVVPREFALRVIRIAVSRATRDFSLSFAAMQSSPEVQAAPPPLAQSAGNENPLAIAISASLPRFAWRASAIRPPSSVDSWTGFTTVPVRRPAPAPSWRMPLRLEALTADSMPQAIVEDSWLARSGASRVGPLRIGQTAGVAAPALVRPADGIVQPRIENPETPGLFIPQLRLGPLRPRIAYGAQDFEAAAAPSKTARRGAVIQISGRRNAG